MSLISDPLRNAKLAGFAAVLVFGWIFILWTNKFHVTAPVVFVCLGYLAVVATVLNLWRTGAAAVAPDDPSEQWGKPIGARGELEKEKRTLLKAIKEAEFDFAMGKLSKADSDALIRTYRARAIEVIKALDGFDAGAGLSTREQIAREIQARIALAEQDKPSRRAKNVVDKKAAAAAARAARLAGKPLPEVEDQAEVEDDGDDDAGGVDDGVEVATPATDVKATKPAPAKPGDDTHPAETAAETPAAETATKATEANG